MLSILNKLANFFGKDIFLVGGCVRDYLLGQPSKDLDFTTPLLPEQILSIAHKNNLKCIPTGLKHGTVTLILDGISYEITTFRKDVLCDGRHASINYTSYLEEDLQRRDFTVNALAMNSKGVLFDPFGGVSDLRQGVLKTVGDPYLRFQEDFLRIMRLVRFKVRYGFNIEQDTFLAAQTLAPMLLNFVSIERVNQEFEKAFQYKNSGEYIKLLDEIGLFTLIFPEFKTAKECTHKPEHHPEGSLFEHIILVMNKATNPKYKWNVLLHDVGKPITATPYENYFRYQGHAHEGAKLIENIATRLKWSTDLRDSVTLTTELHMLPWDWLDAYRGGFPLKIKKRLNLMCGKYLEALKYVCMADDGHNEFDLLVDLFDPLPETVEPILKGRDLIAIGLVPSKSFSELLKKAFDIQIDEGINDKDILLQRVLNGVV